jgi:hypothetical protein
MQNENVIEASLVLDRISGVVPVDKLDNYKGMLSYLHSYKGEPGVKIWKNKYATHADLPLGNDSSLRLQLGVSHHKLYALFDFQPPQLDEEGIAALKDYLTIFLSGGVDQFRDQAHVTYAEFAADFSGVAWTGLLPFDDCLRNSNWYPSPLLYRPTGYLGRRGANRVIRGYDRQKKLLQVEGKLVEGPLTRIEAVCRRTQLTPSTLSVAPNPFCTVGIANLETAFAAFDEAGWHEFLYDCRMQGAQVALWSRMKAIRQQYLNRLRELTVDWWNPHELWTQCGVSLEVLEKVCH